MKRWRVRYVPEDGGKEKTRTFDRKPDAQAYLNTLTADVVRGEYIDPKSTKETFRTVAEDWVPHQGAPQAQDVGRLPQPA